MSSGDAVVQVIQIMPTAENYATFDFRPGGSTPAENIPVYDFDAAAIEYLDFLCKLEGYDSGGLTFTLPFMASTATANETRWGIGIRRLDTAEDVDTAHTYDYNDADATAPGTSGYPAYPTITFTDGADMDSWAEGEMAIVRVRREATHGNDDMAGDAELLGLFGLET